MRTGLAIAPALRGGADWDGVHWVRGEGDNGAARAHRPWLPALPLPGLRQAVLRLVFARACRVELLRCGLGHSDALPTIFLLFRLAATVITLELPADMPGCCVATQLGGPHCGLGCSSQGRACDCSGCQDATTDHCPRSDGFLELL